MAPAPGDAGEALPARGSQPRTHRQFWFEETNGLPRSVVLAFFLSSWAESFPMTAFTALLTDEIGMSLSTITTYYAVSFLPYMWKPAFGWVSDSFPIFGMHRIPYITASAVGSASAYLAFAFQVRSAPGAFAAALCLQSCGAFLQLMIGGFLVDLARKDVSNSVALQSVVNAANWMGTLLAQVMALFIYAHGGGGGAAITSRPAIALTSAAPALIALLAPFLPEVRQADAPRCRCALSYDGVRFAATIVVLQGNLVLIGCQSLMGFDVWRWSVVSTVSASACLLAAAHLPRGWRRERQETAEPILQATQATEGARQSAWWWVRLCAFCFAVNAIPKSSVAIGQFQFTVFTAGSYQALGIISSAASILASLVFGKTFHRRGLGRLFGVSALVAAVAGLAPWPFVGVALHVADSGQQLWSMAGALGVTATVLGAFASLFSVLPVDALVTTASGSLRVDRSCTAYAAFLSCYSFGATVGGLATSPLLEALGLTGKNWTALPQWIAATAAARLLVLPLLLLLPAPQAQGPAPGQLEADPTRRAGQEECEVSLAGAGRDSA